MATLAVVPVIPNGKPGYAAGTAPQDWFYQSPFANRPDLREAFEHGRCLAQLRLAAGDLRAVDERLTAALASRTNAREHVERALRQIRQTIDEIRKCVEVSGKADPAVQLLDGPTEDAGEAQGGNGFGGDICP